MEGKHAELRISGVSTASGGRYRSVIIEGVGKVEGAVRSEGLFRVDGKVTVRGDVQARELRVNGVAKIDGGLSFDAANLDGLVDVFGSAAGERMTLQGLLNVKGDCEAERFEATGGFEIGGLLNAGVVDIRLAGSGKAREIGGGTIRVRKMPRSVWKRLLARLIPKWNPVLQADLIEGDDVDVESTIAAVVRGNRVVLGPGSRVGKVEYRTELIKRPGAKADKEGKIGDGNGTA